MIAKPTERPRLREERMRRTLRVTLTAIGFALGAMPVATQAFTPDQADRVAAVKEGTLSWYTSTPFPLVQQLADKFTEETGVKVQILRSGGEAVIRRFLQEHQAGQRAADVLTMSDAGAANGMTRQGLFAPFRPVGFDKVLETAKDPNGHWIAQRIHLIGMVVRTDRVAEKDRPRTWSDLTDSKFKGQMVMPDPSYTAIQLIVVGMLSQTFGWDFYRALRKNDTMIVQGHQQVYKTMQQGERPIAAEGSDPRSFNNGKEVRNQSVIYPTEGVFVISSPTAIIRNARNPNAARLFAEFMVSPTAQRLVAASAIHSSRVDIAPPESMPALNAVKSFPTDLDHIETKARELKARFNEIFN
jgi:iron(III) transport system substrate-binding protein